MADKAGSNASADGARRRDARTAFWFLLPSLLGFMAFMLYPLVASFGMSFTNWQLMSPPKFVGIDNYVRLFTKDRTFYAVLFNTLFYTIEYLALNIAVSLGLALWIAYDQARPEVVPGDLLPADLYAGRRVVGGLGADFYARRTA